MAGTPTAHQAPMRTSTPSQPQRSAFTPSHPNQYQHSQSPAPFQAAPSPVNQHSFAAPPLTPHGSFHASSQQSHQQNYATPQNYNAGAGRQVAPNFHQLSQGQHQTAASYGGPTGASTGLAPTPLGAPGAMANRGYNAPQAPEVYTLNDLANSSIPEDIRSQFQTDENGRMLFFTTPPVVSNGPSGVSLDVLAGKGAQGKDEKKPSVNDRAMKLRHSIRYLKAKQERDIKVAEKRKRDEEESEANAEEAKKAKKAQEKEHQEQWNGLMAKALDLFNEQMFDWWKADIQRLADQVDGDFMAEVERQKARMEASAALAEQKRAEAEAREKEKQEREARENAFW